MMSQIQIILRWVQIASLKMYSRKGQIKLAICCLGKKIIAENFFFRNFYLFIYLFIHSFMAVLGLRFCARAFSSWGKWGPLFIAVRRPLHYHGLSCCGAQAPDAQARQLWLMGLVAPRHVGSSQTRARTRVPCIGRQIPNHCATREALKTFVYCFLSSS